MTSASVSSVGDAEGVNKWLLSANSGHMIYSVTIFINKINEVAASIGTHKVLIFEAKFALLNFDIIRLRNFLLEKILRPIKKSANPTVMPTATPNRWKSYPNNSRIEASKKNKVRDDIRAALGTGFNPKEIFSENL